MTSIPRCVVCLALLIGLLTPVAGAEDGAVNPGDTVAWITDLPKAFARAKESDRILMICVNAKAVIGGRREEPAAKGLREIVYKDLRVVGKSRAFVCAFVTSDGDSADFGELRALGVEGEIVSPQHIFVTPDGQTILERQEYWSHGSGESAVKALVALMERAETKHANPTEAPPEDPTPGAGPEPGDATMPDAPIAPDAEHAKERTEWIERMLAQVIQGDEATRRGAVESLAVNDKDGDCIDPLIAMLPEQKKNVPVLVDLIRALGRDQLEKAALPIASYLGHKADEVRGNAAVSLEYIGSTDKKVIAGLKKRVAKEDNEGIANHMYRALGRSGATDSKVRALLIKKAEGSKSEFASYGPIIALAYRDGDEKAIRGVEKMLKKIGVPGGRRGGWRNTVKRAYLCWTLAQIGDAKSATFVREELLARLENMQSRWLGALTSFYNAVASACDGDEDAMDRIVEGVRRSAQFGGGGGGFGGGGGGGGGDERPQLHDAYRQDRDTTTFQPKGDELGGGGGE